MPEIKTVRVKPNSPKTRIVSETDSELIVEVAAPAENNKANIELIKLIRGLKSKKKLISV
jgi:uncharacterized protein YggU (UPF0235/DUF167 family)